MLLYHGSPTALDVLLPTINDPFVCASTHPGYAAIYAFKTSCVTAISMLSARPTEKPIAVVYLSDAADYLRSLNGLCPTLHAIERTETFFRMPRAVSHSDEWRSRAPVAVASRRSLTFDDLEHSVFVVPRQRLTARPRTIEGLGELIDSGALQLANAQLGLSEPTHRSTQHDQPAVMPVRHNRSNPNCAHGAAQDNCEP